MDTAEPADWMSGRPRPVAQGAADAGGEAWSLDNTHLPTSVRGVWPYLYLVIDVWSRRHGRRHQVVALNGAGRKDSRIAADLVSRACLRERISW
jgi:hypothetical protein